MNEIERLCHGSFLQKGRVVGHTCSIMVMPQTKSSHKPTKGSCVQDCVFNQLLGAHFKL